MTPSETKEFALVVRVVNCGCVVIDLVLGKRKREESRKFLESVAWETQYACVLSFGWVGLF